MNEKDRWSEPTVEEPDLQGLMTDAIRDEVVTSTDGCLVVYNGICEHGHPSWLVYLGWTYLEGEEDDVELVEKEDNSWRENSKKWPRPTASEPTVEEFTDYVMNGGDTATDGCAVEPDGVCEHGYPSWMLYLGFI